MAIKFTQGAENALNKSCFFAGEFGHIQLGSEHILLGLLSEGEGAAAKILEKYNIAFENTKNIIVKSAGTGKKTNITFSNMTPRTKKILDISMHEALQYGQNYVGTEHILFAVLSEIDCMAVKLIAAQNANPKDMYDDVVSYIQGASSSEFGASSFPFGIPDTGGAGAGNKARRQQNQGGASLNDSPVLKQYGRDLTQLAREGKIDPIIGRDEEMQRVIQILSRRTKNNPCLIGEPGVGKTAVVEGLAQKIADKMIPETLAGKLIVTLDISAMIAGAKYRGEFEERMKGVMGEVLKDPRIILFIDEIHTIIGAGAAEGAVDAANILKPALARGEIQVIGATTINEYRKHIEKDAALERRFQSVMVGEPGPEETVKILKGLRDKYEAHHKVKITDDAVNAAVSLSKRYINDRYLPDKAIDLIDEAASKIRINNYTAPREVKELETKLSNISAEKEAAIKAQNYESAARFRDEEAKAKAELDKAKSEWKNNTNTDDLKITADDIADIVTSWTGIPVRKLMEEESGKLLRLDEILHKRIVGQDEAVTAVAKAIRRGRIGLKDPKRPMGSFIFLGPTGVGKTELTKALAEILFGDENAMIRVDMSEYMEKHSVSKMIGSPPGYVGYDEGGQLTEKIRRRPYSVILFDEIEKAHPDVFNILLQILEDGLLTDAQGRKADFKNTIVIMTSNVGASSIVNKGKSLGFSQEDSSGAADKENIKNKVMSHLKDTFKPEFLNRVDEIIVFNKLTDADIKQIAGIMLGEIKKRIEKLGIDIEFDGDVVELLAKEGFDPVYGARPLRRAIQHKIEDSLSTAMLEGNIKAGDSVKTVAENGGIIYKTER